ncbi:MAG: type II toxin-antitoxin system RelE/ParE family toxin [Gallionella sp.]|nr:type II toxin-antitoxin system RelE/ParE family toxin [Gallionella sp.]
MPKSKKLLDWTTNALDELERGMAFYAEQNPVAARRMQNEINLASLSLIAAIAPEKGRPGRVPRTRELVLGSRTPYILVFREVVNEVSIIQILRVMHTARKYP